jgi:hypothetical protein
MEELFKRGIDQNNWFNNLLDFLSWCDCEIKKCRPKGIAPQSIDITSGEFGFRQKYPSFDKAYEAYLKDLEKWFNEC